MSENALDPRMNAVRADLADVSLRNVVAVERYVDGQNAQLVRTVPIHSRPTTDSTMISQGISGEMIKIFEIQGDWAWIQLRRDRYVGYVSADAVTRSIAFTTHYVNAPTALVFPKPDLKVPPVGRLFLGSELCIGGTDNGYVELSGGGFVAERCVSPLGTYLEDFVSMAERFAGVPYLWGGKTAVGLDCSGLIQIALQATGADCLRDSDMQMASVGTSLGSSPDLNKLQRGDLVFWKGHVGVMVDAKTLLHANAYHMEVTAEPLAEAVARIALTDTGAITDVRRYSADSLLIGAVGGHG